MQVSAGDFDLIYDPSAGEQESWYVNDHTFIRDHTGTWHLIGITHAEPAAPNAGDALLWAPHVIEHDDRYWMFVCAGGTSMDAYRIHLAVSDDCVHWERDRENPMVVDGYEARDPMVVRLENRGVMYYTATSTRAVATSW